jgi:signal-transduction protein with cAMP-binding, CBS, and nucleotidyltransferase domain
MDAYPPLLSREALGAVRICRPVLTYPHATLDSPAIEVMTDLTQVPPVVIDPQESMELAQSYMRQRGVRMLLAMNQDDRLAGIITASDLLGEVPIAMAREQGKHHADILVADLMTPANQLDAFELRRVVSASVGHIVSSLQRARRHHALVVQPGDDGEPQVRGIFSLSQIARQLGRPLQLPEGAGSFAEIEAALAAE